jgi:hypothetical protein
MKDFNIAKYLKENKLGPHAILGGYVDLHNLKKEEETKLDTEIPYEGPERKVDGFGDEFVQDSPVEEKAGKDDKDSLMSKLFAIQKKYGYKKARPDQEEYENVRIAPTVARVGNKIVEDGGIAISIESKVSKAAFTDIKNLLQTKFPGWQIDPQSVTKDDDFDTDSKNVLFFDIVKNQPVKEGVEDGSFNVSLMYADYPSISNAEQRLAIMHLKKLVKSLGGIATITNDAFDTVDFNVTGISSFQELQNAYNDVVENEDDDYTMLPSWDLEPISSPVQEAGDPPFGMPDKSEENPWMDEVDGTDAYKFGNWTCYYDYPGVLAWSYKDVPLSKLAVYATPDWNDDGTTPIQIDIDEKSQDQMTLKQSEFADFNEYATAMKPYLDRIEDLESNWGSLSPSNDSMDTDDSVNPFPSIMKEKEDSMMFDKGWQYDDEVSNDDRFADLGGDQIKSAIKSLMDDGFDTREIAQFVVDTIRSFKSFKEEVTVSSSGVQMEKK